MANAKRTSTRGNVTASKVRAVTKKKSSKSAHDSPQDGKVAIFVRISQEAKNILDEAAEFPIPSMTNVRVIERLLEHFKNIKDRNIQEDILRGVYVNPIKEFEDWQASLLLAQHAYDNKRYILAEQLYKQLAGDRSRSEKFIGYCQYKLGLCWMGISNELRYEALLKKNETNDYQCFEIAQKSLDEAIDCTKKVKEALGPLFNLILHYNRACCYSMKAQYKVEASIDLNKDQITELCRATDDFTAVKMVWEEIGKKWRGDDKRIDIDSEAEKAFDELKEIFPLPPSENSLPPTVLAENSVPLRDRIWLVEAALKDKDLIFLHTDEKKWQPKFKMWSESALSGDISIATTVQDLLNKK